MLRALVQCSVAAFLSLSVGCGDEVVLGSECGPGVVPCTQRDQRRRAADASAVPYDGAGDAGEGATDGPEPTDAGVVADARVPSGAPWGIENPSFEVAPGSSAGAISTGSTGSNADPWTSCIGTANLVNGASASTGFGGGVQLLPTDGAAFLSLSLGLFGPGGIVQPLAAPLRAGQRYAFAVDLASAGFTSPTLIVRSGSSACTSATSELVQSSAVAPAQAWSTQCIAFTPDADVNELVLAIGNALAGGTLFVDHLREDPSCL